MRGLLALQNSGCGARGSAASSSSISVSNDTAAATNLRGTTPSDVRALREACIALATVTAPHHWSAALSLIEPDDAVCHTAALGELVDALSRCAELPRPAYHAWVRTLLTHVLRCADARNALTSLTAKPTALCSSSASSRCTPSSSSLLPTPSHPQMTSDDAVLRWSRHAHDSFESSLLLLYHHATRWMGYREAWHLYEAVIAPAHVGAHTKSIAYERVRQLSLWHAQSPCSCSSVVGSTPAWRAMMQGCVKEKDEEENEDAAAMRVPSTQQRGSVRQSQPAVFLSHDTCAPSHARIRRHLMRAVQLSPAVEDVGWALRVCTRIPAQSQNTPNIPHAGSSHTYDKAAAAQLNMWDTRTTRLKSNPVLTLSWRIALATCSRHAMTPELWPLHVRAVGLCAPHRWLQALRCMPHAANGAAEIKPRTQTNSPARPSGTHTFPDEAVAAVWHKADRHEDVDRLLCLWLTRRASWRAAAVLARQYLDTRTNETKGGDGHANVTEKHSPSSSSSSSSAVFVSLIADLLARTAMPPSALYRLFPSSHTPSYTLPEPTRRAVAQALARGVRCDALQLSALAKQWARVGDWQGALLLYARFPNPEFQRRALQALLHKMRQTRQFAAAMDGNNKSSRLIGCSDTEAASRTRCSQRVPLSPTPASSLAAGYGDATELWSRLDRCGRGRCPPSTYTTSTLIQHASSWREGLYLFRACVQRNATVQAKMLSALMDVRVPYAEMTKLVHAYGSAVTPGIRARMLRLQREEQQQQQ